MELTAGQRLEIYDRMIEAYEYAESIGIDMGVHISLAHLMKHTDHYESGVERWYVIVATLAGRELFGVTNLSDAVHAHDAIDGHQQSLWEQVSDGTVGTVQLASTACGLKAGFSRLKPTNSVSPGGLQARFLEYKALRAQGLKASEAHGLMKQFDAGMISPQSYLFHFTNAGRGTSIVNGRLIYASRSGFGGTGVYAGTTSTPGFVTKHVPIIGWGLGRAPVRIPIIVTDDLARIIRRPLLPILRTRIIGNGQSIPLGGGG
jgi:hypothetical protein